MEISIGSKAGRVTTGPNTGYPPSTWPAHDNAAKEDTFEKLMEEEYTFRFSKSILQEQVKKFKAGKYTEKFIRAYLEFVLMEGIIDNLTYLEYLKEIGEKA